MYKAEIGIEKDNTDKVRKVCEDIKKRDESFVYDIIKSHSVFLGRFENILVIFDTEEGVNSRAGWFIHKMKDAKVSDFFISKECRDIEYMRKNTVVDKYESILKEFLR